MDVKLKWRVSSVPTGRYRSFENRHWPHAEYENGEAAATILCTDEYRPKDAREGKHAPLRVRIADHSPSLFPEKRAKYGSFIWRDLKSSFSSLKEAKRAVLEILKRHPEMMPLHYLNK